VRSTQLTKEVIMDEIDSTDDSAVLTYLLKAVSDLAEVLSALTPSDSYAEEVINRVFDTSTDLWVRRM
jgi:hypothetical protein